uniref:Large ribosomal subunit protein mL45 n=1 Tax=Panagrolaimus superbus TaxID=310955 RepID=A0A914YWP5_9BILA
MLSRQLPQLRLLASTGCVTTQICSVHHHKERHDLERFIGMKRSNPAKANRNTNTNEYLFRKARAKKTLIIDLPEDSQIREREKLGPNELRYKFLEKGINPYKDVTPRTWTEHQATYQSFYGVIDSFIKPSYVINNDPNPPATNKKFTTKVKEQVSHIYHDQKSVRRIRKKEGLQSFSKKSMPPVLEKIYIDAHQALVNRNKNELHNLITEHAFAKMWPDVENGSVRWELIRFNEPTKIVSVRCEDNPGRSGNDIAQVIARFHSTQKLAVYDRFGKLVLGSETDEKDTLEFVVFECHVASLDGEWRLHDKVYPSGIAPKEGPLDKKIIENLPEDEELRPTASVPLKVRITERINEEIKEEQEKEKIEK